MAQTDSPVLIRAGEAAKLLGVHPVTLRRWTDAGHFPPPVRLGPRRYRYYAVADIERHLAQSTENGRTNE